MPLAPEDEPLTLSTLTFADGDTIPDMYTCKGYDISPSLVWSAPSGGALVVSDLDAPNGNYIHWIFTGLPPGSGKAVDGEIPYGVTEVPNSVGKALYSGPCPPAGSGVHHYRFTLYQLPPGFALPAGLAGSQAAEAITKAATAQAGFTGTFAG